MQTSNAQKVQGDVVKWEVHSGYTREAITIVSGAGDLKVGTVLGKITASGKYTPSSTGAADGSQTAVAVLLDNVDATSADKVANVLIRGAALVDETNLIYHASVDDATKRGTKKTQLLAVGILAKKGA